MNYTILNNKLSTFSAIIQKYPIFKLQLLWTEIADCTFA